MNILFDYQILVLQKYGGISRYYYELMSEMQKNESNEVFLPIAVSQNYYFRNIIKPTKKMHFRIDNIRNTLKTLHCCKSKKIDIIHPTYYFPEYLRYLPKSKRKTAKVIITVYDLICELFYPDLDRGGLKKRKEIIMNADGIIAISEHTKNDLLKVYPELNPEKIKVIYLAASMERPDKKIDTSFLPSKYILFVGKRSLYKNGITLLKAFSEISKKYPDVSLVMAGGGEFDEEELEIIKAGKYEDRIIQKNLSDDELYYAYKNAECFVFPSLYEGFGIPILEAFYCDCPVALSNSSCFPEIAQDAAVYFDGKDTDSMANAIEELLSDGEKRNEYRLRGQKRLADFTWGKVAKETLNFYQYIMERNETV